MASYHQMGHDSRNLLFEEDLGAYRGAVLSPVDYNQDQVADIVRKRQSRDFEMILDPQLYYPRSQRRHLPTWGYFPSDVDSADLNSTSWWRDVVRRLRHVVVETGVRAVCSPAVVPRTYSPDYYVRSRSVAETVQDRVAGRDVDVLHTVLVPLQELADADRAAEIASTVSGGRVERVYLIFISARSPRRELADAEELKGAIWFLRALGGAQMRVLVGFASSDVVLWKAGGATDCATGKFFNLRRFTPSRFEAPPEGGGQVTYWFEEGLVAFLRQADLLRVKAAGMLSDASRANPFGQRILQQLAANPGIAWLADSWRQYMYWFAEIESRLSADRASAAPLLRAADKAWSALDARDILMEERGNDGAWVRAWRRAVTEATTTA